MPGAVKKIFFILSFALLAIAANTNAYRDEIFVIEMINEGFLPQNIEIKQGQAVVFENKDAVNRWPSLELAGEVASDAGPIQSVPPGEKWNYTFYKKGSWQVRDRAGREFSASIFVKEDDGYTPARPEEKPQRKNGGVKSQDSFFKQILQFVISLFVKDKNGGSANKQQNILENENDLLNYMRRFGAGKTISQLEALTASAKECHAKTHLVGKHAYELFKNNAFQWHAFAFDSACNSGFFHGLMDAFWDGNKILKGSCDDSSFSLKCAHVVGHSLMASNNYDLQSALKQCERLSGQNAIEIEEECFRGVFMENADGGINPEAGHESKHINQDPLYPCTKVLPKYKNACWQFVPGRLQNLHGENSKKMLEACARVPGPYNQACFSSVGSIIALAHKENHQKNAESCRVSRHETPGGVGKTMCDLGVVSELISNPKTRKNALNFCNLLKNNIEISNCYNSALLQAKTLLAENYQNFCSSLEKKYRSICADFSQPYYVLPP